MWTKSFGNWLKSGSEPRPLWRRDPGLDLFAGISKKPLVYPAIESDEIHLLVWLSIAAAGGQSAAPSLRIAPQALPESLRLPLSPITQPLTQPIFLLRTGRTA